MVEGRVSLLSDDPLTLLGALGVVGDWVHDLWANRIALSSRLAGVLGIDAGAAARGIPLSQFLGRMQPADRPRLEAGLIAASEVGGEFEAHFETLPAENGTRNLRLRGRVERDEGGRSIRSYGIAIDFTDGRSADLASFGRRLNCMADHAIALRGLVEDVDHPELVGAIDALMIQIGFELAGLVLEAEGPPN